MDLRVFHDVKSGRQKLAIFGAGRYGKAMYVIMHENGIPVSFFIDNSPQHDGKTIIGGVKCAMPQPDNKNVICVIAVNDVYGDEILYQTNTMGFAAVYRIFNYEMEPFMDEIDDERCTRLLYKGLYNREINLDNPKTYTEKLNWLKLYDRKPAYTKMVDKYVVRDMISNTIGKEYLIPLIGGPWESADDIDFHNLPNQFVLKCNHDCGSVYICKDKNEIDYDLVSRRFEMKLKANFYYMHREWVYKNVPPRVIAEEYIQENSSGGLTDYKFFCFHGEPKIVLIEFNRDKAAFFKSPPSNYYLINGWENLNFNTPNVTDKDIMNPTPKCLPEMLDIARTLSRNLPHVRIDLYDIDGRIYFSEITFTNFGGFPMSIPEEWDKRMGSWIDLSELRGRSDKE
jgi:hypothetical protein